MKFGREFETALATAGFDQQWIDTAVPYGQLKKVIKKVARELKQNGLDPTKLAELHELVEYGFDGNQHPKLTIFYDENNNAVDATLSPETIATLKSLAEKNGVVAKAPSEFGPEEEEIIDDSPDPSRKGSRASGTVFRIVEVRLTMDAEFFQILQGRIDPIIKIQENHEKELVNQIHDVKRELELVTKPSKHRKTDMYQWRELFDIYLQAAPFFPTSERDHGVRDSAAAKRQLEWFQAEIARRGLQDKFKLKVSRKALNEFFDINQKLFSNLKYMELQKQAVVKIMKKFDKKTQLSATDSANQLIQPNSNLSETIAKAVCAQIYEEIVKTTPQLDDYYCPICFTIEWRPIRLKCGHVFCILCTVKMQKEKKKFCPLCRSETIMEADTDNIDAELSKYIKTYFPKEYMEKKIELETIAGREQFGASYKHPSEQKCALM